ncbi:hypothetical protein TNCV_4338801 [Trichonephila clavipes]|nr:hypothetical protein TNCV_4338801 [Trichonephila clavipes]
MQPKAKYSLRAQAQLMRTETVETVELVKVKQKLRRAELERERRTREDFVRVVEKLNGTVENTDTIVKLKTKIENSSTFKSDPDFVKTLIQNCIDERKRSENKREANFKKTEKLSSQETRVSTVGKEVENFKEVKNKALSLNPAAKLKRNSSKL